MIIVNDKKIDTANKEEAFVRNIYEPQIKWLRSLKKKYFTFTFPDSKVRIDEQGHIKTSAGAWVPFRERYMTQKDGTLDVIYYRTSFYEAKHGREMYRPRKFDFRGTVALSFDKDADLIWFLIFVSPHIEASDWLKDAPGMNRIRKNNQIFYKLENKVRDAEKEYDFMADVTRALTLIYDQHIGLTGEQLNYVARSYNVTTGEGITEKAVRQELGKRIISQKNGKYEMKPIKEFLEMVPEKGSDGSMDDRVMTQAVVNDLIDLEMIKSVQKGTKFEWVTDTGNPIVKYTPSQDGKIVLIDHLVRNPEARESFEQDVKKRKEELEPSTQPVTQ